MDPIEFHDLSKTLVQGSTAAEIRSAVSRAYYAAFHVAAGILREMGFSISTAARGHADVTDRLMGSGHDDVVRIGRDIQDLRTMRNKADYDLVSTHPDEPRRAKIVVTQVGQIITDLQQHCGGPQRTQIAASIGAWEAATGNPSNP